MKHFILHLIFISSLFGQESIYFKKINILEQEQLKVAANYFFDLNSKSLIARTKILKFVKQTNNNPNQPLSGEEIESLQEGVLSQIYLREELYRLINSYRQYPYVNGGENLVSVENRLKGGLIGLAAACVVADNYALSLKQVQEHELLRRLVNKGDSGKKVNTKELQNVVNSYNSRDKRKEFRKGIDWFIKHRQKLKVLKEKDEQLTKLADLIIKSPAAKALSEGNFFSDYFSKISKSSVVIHDRVKGLKESSTNSLSKLFGNSVGMVQFRKGKLFGDNDIEEKMATELEPLDIILEKTPFRLTDKFIPGHFGHVAIWVGSEKQLKNTGLWNHPAIAPYHEEIKKGCSVLEALRDGVQLNTLEHFLDVDDVAILRKSSKQSEASILRAFSQIGKEYDFNFDVEASDKIVCSELVYHVFVDVDWPIEKTMGRFTISPDNVAVKAIDGLFDVKLFVHNGREATFEKYRDLIAE